MVYLISPCFLRLFYFDTPRTGYWDVFFFQLWPRRGTFFHPSHRVCSCICPETLSHKILVPIYYSWGPITVGVLLISAFIETPRNLGLISSGVTPTFLQEWITLNTAFGKRKGFLPSKTYLTQVECYIHLNNWKLFIISPTEIFFMYLQAGHYVQSNTTLAGGVTNKDAFSELMTWIKFRPFKTRYLYPSLLEPTVVKI